MRTLDDVYGPELDRFPLEQAIHPLAELGWEPGEVDPLEGDKMWASARSLDERPRQAQSQGLVLMG